MAPALISEAIRAYVRAEGDALRSRAQRTEEAWHELGWAEHHLRVGRADPHSGLRLDVLEARVTGCRQACGDSGDVAFAQAAE